MKGSSAAWVIKSHWQKEQRSGSGSRLSRARRSEEAPHRLLMFAAFLGCPASDLALVLGVDRGDLLEMVRERTNLLSMCDLEALLDWIGLLWWRRLWRTGDEWAATPAAIEEAIKHTGKALWVPQDVERDLEIAALEALRQCEPPTPKEERAKRGRSNSQRLKS